MKPIGRILLFLGGALAAAAQTAPTICPRFPAGSAITAPEDLFSSNGVLRVQFTYRTNTDQNGNTLFCFTAADGAQSPTLHVNPGDLIVMTVTNAVPETTGFRNLPEMRAEMTHSPAAHAMAAQPQTVGGPVCGSGFAMTPSSVNMHFHGTNTPATCHQDEVIRTIINSGESFEYDLQIPPDEPPGLYWYHPHVHGISEGAVLGGASGAIVVEGLQNVNSAVAGLAQQLLIVRDNVVPGDNLPDDAPAKDLSLNYVPVPYPLYPPAQIVIRPGELQLWRVLNAAADTILDLQLIYDGQIQPLQIVGLDGVPVGSQDGTMNGVSVTRNDILIPPAGRAEFIVTGPAATVHSAVLSTLNIDTGPDGDNDPARPLATVMAATPGATSSAKRLAEPSKLPPKARFTNLASVAPSTQRNLYFSEMSLDPGDPDASVIFFITVSGQTPRAFDPANPPAIVTTVGAVEDWTIENHTLENHEFHMHQIHFLLVQQNGVPVNNGQYTDTIDVPHWDGTGPYPSVTLRMDFRGVTPADFVYHCHILAHEDSGMMATIRIVAPSAALSIAKTHTGSFAQGQQGVYTVTVSNPAAGTATNGAVTVTETVPSGITLASMAGPGWTCASNTCSRSDVLNPGAAYPPITVTVNVAVNASSPQVNSATLSGTGISTATATDSTVIAALTPIFIQTVPPGLQFTVDGGAPQTAPKTMNLSQGPHTLAVAATQILPVAANPNVSVVGNLNSTAATGTVTLTGGVADAGTFSATIPSNAVLSTAPSITVPYTMTLSGGVLSGDWTFPPAWLQGGSGTGSATVTSATGRYLAGSFPALSGGGGQIRPGIVFFFSGTASITSTAQTQYVFNAWSDGGAASHTITVGPLSAAYTATFLTQYQLTTAASPAAGGTVTPAGGALYNQGAAVSITASANPGYVFSGWTGSVANPAVASTSVTMSAPEAVTANFTAAASALRFVPVAPCRVLDTRGANGPFGGPPLAAGATRDVLVPQGACNVPFTAQAYSLNVTAVPLGPLNYLSVFPSISVQPGVSTLNSFDGRIVANAAIVPAGTGGGISVFASNATNVILDIDGYFVPASTAGSLSFYAAPPCRVVDTRNAAGPLSGPFLAGSGTRSFSISSGSCGIPTTAQAYSLNITAVPHGTLGFLTAWPAGQPPPAVSTLNSSNGAVVANAAIVPAGASGGINLFATNDTDVVIDVDGYFAPPGGPNALSLYTLPPCRVTDTRNAPGAFGGPALAANATRTFALPSSACNVPPTAQAYSMNVTVVPLGPLAYLTAWPAGQAQPVASTLNSFNGAVVANAALVPAGTAEAISVFVSNPTNLILDINGYFAP